MYFQPKNIHSIFFLALENVDPAPCKSLSALLRNFFDKEFIKLIEYRLQKILKRWPYQSPQGKSQFWYSKSYPSSHRWGHIPVVQYLLSNKFMWPSKEMKKAYEQASNKEVKSLSKAELDKDRKSFFKRLLSSPRKTPKALQIALDDCIKLL